MSTKTLDTYYKRLILEERYPVLPFILGEDADEFLRGFRNSLVGLIAVQEEDGDDGFYEELEILSMRSLGNLLLQNFFRLEDALAALDVAVVASSKGDSCAEKRAVIDKIRVDAEEFTVAGVFEPLNAFWDAEFLENLFSAKILSSEALHSLKREIYRACDQAQQALLSETTEEPMVLFEYLHRPVFEEIFVDWFQDSLQKNGKCPEKYKYCSKAAVLNLYRELVLPRTIAFLSATMLDHEMPDAVCLKGIMNACQQALDDLGAHNNSLEEQGSSSFFKELVNEVLFMVGTRAEEEQEDSDVSAVLELDDRKLLQGPDDDISSGEGLSLPSGDDDDQSGDFRL